MRRIFQLGDPDGTGFVTLSSYKSMCAIDIDSFMGGGYSVSAMFEAFDTDHDGKLSLPELGEMLRSSFEYARRKAQEHFSDSDSDESDGDV